MLPGLTREAEEQKLQEIIGIAQQNLERARADIRKVNEDLEDLLEFRCHTSPHKICIGIPFTRQSRYTESERGSGRPAGRV